MSVITITITAPNVSVADMNSKLSDASNPQNGMNKLENLVTAIEGGSIDASVAVVVSGVGGDSVTYNLL